MTDKIANNNNDKIANNNNDKIANNNDKIANNNDKIANNNDKIAKCLKIAELAYRDVNEWDIKDVIYKKFNNSILDIVHIYHFFEQDNLYISIRGSDCISDILDDIDIYKVNFKELNDEKINVHKGLWVD